MTKVLGEGQRTAYERLVSVILKELAIGVYYKGYHNLCESILLVLEDGARLYNLQQSVYSVLATPDTNPKSVGKAIGNVIDRAWDKLNPDIAIKYFGYYDKSNPPTNKQFIAAIVEYIKLNHQ